MAQITARVPDELAEALDAAAVQLGRSRAAVVRQALERYLERLRPTSQWHWAGCTILQTPFWTGTRSGMELVGSG